MCNCCLMILLCTAQGRHANAKTALSVARFATGKYLKLSWKRPHWAAPREGGGSQRGPAAGDQTIAALSSRPLVETAASSGRTRVAKRRMGCPPVDGSRSGGSAPCFRGRKWGCYKNVASAKYCNAVAIYSMGVAQLSMHQRSRLSGGWTFAWLATNGPRWNPTTFPIPSSSSISAAR